MTTSQLGPDPNPLVLASRAAGHATRRLAMRALAPAGQHPGQEVALLALAEREVLTQSQLAAILEIEPPSMNGILVKLEHSGLVTRVQAGRTKQVRLTDAGRSAAAASAAAYSTMERALRDGLSDDEVNHLKDALDQVADHARRALAEPDWPYPPQAAPLPDPVGPPAHQQELQSPPK